jgi:hypothetical protein
METETQFIDPAKASSALGQAIARLLQASGLEIDIDAFGEIDEIAGTLKSLQAQLIELDRAQESDKEEMSDRIEQIEDAPGQNEVDEINSRLSDLEANFTALYDSIPIADRPDLDRCVDLSFS